CISPKPTLAAKSTNSVVIGDPRKTSRLFDLVLVLVRLDHVASFEHQGHPTPVAGASIVSTCPVRARATSGILFMPRHSVAIMNNVFLSGPPSMHAKQPRSILIVCSTSPPSRTRTHRLFGTSAYQTAFSASRQIPSGAPAPKSAQTCRFDR